LTLERSFHRQTAFVVRPSPAVVAYWPKEDEADFQGFGGESAATERWQRRKACGHGLQEVAPVDEIQVPLPLLGPIGESERTKNTSKKRA
jgi:hypothetical protein